jgi:GR25 family glycosyltransferase involved in LPS biosynthesis
MNNKTNIVVINLDRSTDRLERFTTHANKNNIKFNRFAGIDKYDTELVDTYMKQFDVRLKRQHGACAVSHLLVISEFIESDYEHIVIFEDDAQIMNNTFLDIDTLTKEINITPDQFDILYLNCRVQCDKAFKVVNGCGLEGYILNKKGAKKILDCSRCMKAPIDLHWQNHFERMKRFISVHKDITIQAYKTKKHSVKHVDLAKSYLNGV